MTIIFVILDNSFGLHHVMCYGIVGVKLLKLQYY